MIKVVDDVVEKFNALKLDNKYKAVRYKLDTKDNNIVVDLNYPNDKKSKDILNGLPQNECRFLVLDWDYKIDGFSLSNILLISWAPDAVENKDKMLHAQSESILKSALTGVLLKIQARDLSEVSDDVISSAIFQW